MSDENEVKQPTSEAAPPASTEQAQEPVADKTEAPAGAPAKAE